MLECMTRAAEFWNAVYDNDTAPWVIGGPQPTIVALEREGWITGRVLDPGSGAGEHTILLTKLGYEVLGIDLSPSAVAYARRNAVEKGVPTARFEVGDTLALSEMPDIGVFDTVVDSALFHIFGTDPDARAQYVTSLHAVLRPGGLLHILALSDAEEGFGPRISDTIIRESFGAGWELEDLQASRYHGRVTEAIADQVGLPSSGPVDATAWLTRIRRR